MARDLLAFFGSYVTAGQIMDPAVQLVVRALLDDIADRFDNAFGGRCGQNLLALDRKYAGIVCKNANVILVFLQVGRLAIDRS